MELHLGGSCELSCPTCDCRKGGCRPDELQRAITGGGSRLLLRGDAARRPELPALVDRAREEGFGEIVVRTHAQSFGDPEQARRFAASGVDTVLVPLFSHVPQVHDRLAGRPDSLVRTLMGMRALAAAGVAVEVEVPLLPLRLQKLTEVVELAGRAVGELRAVHFFLPRWEVPAGLAPPDWSEGAPALAEALRHCKDKGITTALRSVDGVPLCALRDFPELHTAYRFNPKTRTTKVAGATHLPACDGCAAKGQCPGVARSYERAHAEAGLKPYSRRPNAMYEQRTSPRRVWTDGQRQAARRRSILVLRPTVNCNQDCTFCSANETSGNVWSDPQKMVRSIARAARHGIQRLSFSGGEPTLSRHLPAFIRVASRLGMRDVEIVTNGVLLDSEAKVKTLREAGLTHAFVSMHAHDEPLARILTQKAGDFPRTVKAVRHLIDAGVITVLNHVINARNYRYLTHFVEFVHAQYGSDTMISFAFVTPQYKALEDMEQVPRLSEVMPHLKRAMHRALELDQPFVVGSRQGVPPCFLREFQAWSDLLGIAGESLSEDQPQKIQGEACGECIYRNHCTGLWRPYAARYGTTELEPIRGQALTSALVRFIRSARHPFPWGVPRSFEGVPDILRLKELEQAGPPEIREKIPETAELVGGLVKLGRTRPLRLAMIGSGRRARHLAREALKVPGLSIDAVASPHAPEGLLPEFGHCPRFRTADEAIAEMRPEAVIVAAATHAHHASAKAALLSGSPVLVEKPLARTEEEAEELVRLAADRGLALMPAYNDLFASGLDQVLQPGAGRLSYLRRTTPASPEALRTWSRAGLSELLHHVLAVVGAPMGGGVPTVENAGFHGEARPERIRLQLQYPAGPAEVRLEFATNVDLLSITALRPDGEVEWRRSGRSTTLVHAGQTREVESSGSELERMLTHFRDVVLGRDRPRIDGRQGLELMRAVAACLAALDEAGAPFERQGAPKHVASRMPERLAR